MMTVIIVLIMLLSVISVIVIPLSDVLLSDGSKALFLISMMIFILSVILLIGDFHPTAMDVYQGKTTLKYTIVDGIKTDSVVIYKRK